LGVDCCAELQVGAHNRDTKNKIVNNFIAVILFCEDSSSIKVANAMASKKELSNAPENASARLLQRLNLRQFVHFCMQP
jgi:hypothetical protein